jgi:hypothetical protein
MARAYCKVDDVRIYLPSNIIIEGTNPTPNPRNPNPETLLIENMEFYIDQACMIIDSALASQFDIPLKAVNMGGVIRYPDAIVTIAAVLAAEMIYEQKLQGMDQEKSDMVKQRLQWANNELVALQNGERRLVGQRSTRASRFVRNTLYNSPRNPASEGKSRGQG